MRSGWLAALGIVTLSGCSVQNVQAINTCQDVAAKPSARIDSCTAAINAGKQSPATLAAQLTNRGIAYAQLGAYDRAIQDYDRALKLRPDNLYAYLNRGRAYARSGHPDKAIADFDRIIQFKPDLASAFFYRGLA